jgi:hypothetical protein
MEQSDLHEEAERVFIATLVNYLHAAVAAQPERTIGHRHSTTCIGTISQCLLTRRAKFNCRGNKQGLGKRGPSKKNRKPVVLVTHG